MDFTEVEIEGIPPLGAGDSCLLEMHSLLNAMNVLRGEITLLGFYLADDGEHLHEALAACDEVTRNLSDPVLSARDAEALPRIRAGIEGCIRAALVRFAGKAEAAEVRESAENIEAVFAILEVRAAEILARRGAPDRWDRLPIDELRADLRAVFAAIEKNSHGRYRIVYNLARQEIRDYYVDFAFESEDGRTVCMPPVFTDVIRDLMANARKYTAPGGTISAGLHQTKTLLRFVVSDTGCGIPPEEIPLVVHYGRRGSNVAHVRTMGGGFGLTKAFLVTKRFGGRFWIRSVVGSGTRVRIEIPVPSSCLG
jgi:signal transduction histidine kinase